MRLINRFYRIRVSGKGQFPIDQLRRDQCFPMSERDSAMIDDSRDQPFDRTIELGCSTARHPLSVTTPDRWRSFGWTVDSVDVI